MKTKKNTRPTSAFCWTLLGLIVTSSLFANLSSILLFHRMTGPSDARNLRRLRRDKNRKELQSQVNKLRDELEEKKNEVKDMIGKIDEGVEGMYSEEELLKHEGKTVDELDQIFASDRDAKGRPRAWPKPRDWKSTGFHDIRKHLRCKSYAHDQEKPLPSIEDWRFFQKMYMKAVRGHGALTFREDPVPPTKGYTLGDGGPPPYYAALSVDGRGRGLFASRDIKRGELVHDGDVSDITFPDAMSWRRFIFSLPRRKACDMVDWTWTQKTEKRGPYKIRAAMNISVLLNTSGDMNINPRSSVSSKFYATKDIMKDEELLMDYSVYNTDWEEVGLGTSPVIASI